MSRMMVFPPRGPNAGFIVATLLFVGIHQATPAVAQWASYHNSPSFSIHADRNCSSTFAPPPTTDPTVTHPPYSTPEPLEYTASWTSAYECQWIQANGNTYAQKWTCTENGHFKATSYTDVGCTQGADQRIDIQANGCEGPGLYLHWNGECPDGTTAPAPTSAPTPAPTPSPEPMCAPEDVGLLLKDPAAKICDSGNRDVLAVLDELVHDMHTLKHAMAQVTTRLLLSSDMEL